VSAEGKKKRGESGQSNAKNISFRYGGSKCDFSTRIGTPIHPRKAGARFLSAMALGAMLPGFDKVVTRGMIAAADLCMDHCTVERPI
jgi:hypothetical protein